MIILVNYSMLIATADDVEKVRQALANPKWDFRTVDGIVRETGLNSDLVADALLQMKEEIRTAQAPDRLGRDLFTLKSRPPKLQERLAALRSFLATTS